MKTCKMLLLFLFLISLAGCTTRQGSQPSVEKLAMISVIGFDYVDEDNSRITVIMPQPATEAAKHTQIITVETDMLNKGLTEISAQVDQTVTLKQLRVVLFSEEFARKGKMKDVMMNFYRFPDVRTNTYAAVVKDSAEDMLRMEYPDKQNTSVYMNNFFQPKPFTFFSPFTNIHKFVYDETNPLIDTIVPYVELKDNNINISGIAMFNNGKMEEVFSQQEGIIIQVLRGLSKISLFSFYLDEEQKEKVSLKSVESDLKMTAKNMESPKVSIELKFKGTLSEYEGGKDIELKKEIVTLEKEVSKVIEEDILKFLEKCRDLSIDPVGMFESLRMRYKGEWKMELTKQLLSKAEFEVKVDTKLISAGTLK